MCITGLYLACVLTSASGIAPLAEQAVLDLDLNEDMAEIAAQAEIRFPDADRKTVPGTGRSTPRRNSFAMGPVMPMSCDGSGRHQMFGVLSNGQEASCEEGSFSVSLTIRNR